MNIENDTITFSAEDFDGLSDFAKKAVAELARNAVPALDGTFEAEASKLVNSYISSAKENLKSRAGADPVTDSILAGLAKADEATLDAAAPLLVKLNSLLNP